MKKINAVSQPPMEIRLPAPPPKSAKVIKNKKPLYIEPGLPALICGIQQKLDC